MTHTITTREGRTIWTGEATSVADAVQRARAARANLWGANLVGADLRGANLWGADLVGADLVGANLRGANLWGASLVGANLSGADLWGANLWGANLVGANLVGANLRGASLRGANLRDASLRGANLSGADLGGANLGGAEGLASERVSPLHILRDQPGAIRAYKLVAHDYQSPLVTTSKLTYVVGQSYHVDNANTDIAESCGAGLHVATMDWILRQHEPGLRVLLVEFTAADIACIPTATDGKFRLHRLTVVGEVDLVARGLISGDAGR